MSEPVARGRIKVDARKALDKLRDHMLVDPHLWACELARVAVALGATKLDVSWSSSDFTLELDGRALPIAQIARARDHVLTPFDGPDGDALRSLGIGIGAALGLDPAYIEVTSGNQRVRFERNYVDDAAETEAPVPAAAEPVVGTRVQMKRRLGLGSITRAISSDVPEEAQLLEQHVDRSRLALNMKGSLLADDNPALLTVDLDVPGATRAVLEIHPPNAKTSAVQFYEHGVLLTSFEAKPWGLTGLPIRYVVDAPRLPTNASRSQMRSDAELTRRVVDRVLPMFVVATRAMRGEQTFGHDVKLLGSKEAIANALGAIVAQVVLAVQTTKLPPEAQALVDVPVVYDPVGRLVPLTALRGGTREAPLRVYSGDEALPLALAPWLEGMLWRRGLAAEYAVKDLITAPADELVIPAKKALERRARAMQHAPSPPVVTPSEATIHRESFKVEQGPFAGLHGEIAVVKSDRGRLAKARVFVDERALEEMPLPGVRLPVDIALAWPERIVARFEYDAVQRNDDLARALHVALRLASVTIASHYVGADGKQDPELVRFAIAAWAEATRMVNDNAPLGSLSAATVWRTNDGRLVSLDQIKAYAAVTGAVCFAKSPLPSRDGRIVVARADFDALRMLLPDAVFVGYDEYLEPRPELPEAPSRVAVALQRGPLEGYVTPGFGRIRVYHAGARIKSEVYQSTFGAVDVVLADRAAVPKPNEFAAIYATAVPELFNEEQLLLEKTIDGVEQGMLEYADVEKYLSQSMARMVTGALRSRAEELPSQSERKRRERMKGDVLARAPFDFAARIGDIPRGTASNRRGAVSVVLIAEEMLPNAFLLYRGHPLGSIPGRAYPLSVFIDVVDDDLVTEDWTKLSEAGATWAEVAIVDAALALLQKLIERDDFADSVMALKLLGMLLHESPARAGAILQTVRWPTVQGLTTKISDDVRAKVGGNRYDPWRTFGDPSPFDAPAIHLPVSKIGEARRRVLDAAGITLEDVTEPIARLQTLRGKSERTPPPRLDGTPAHPALRASLGQLGVTLAEGELELFDGDWSQVTKVDKEGVSEPVPFALSFPVRVVCRVDGQWFHGIEREIQRAVWDHVRGLVPKADELPTFARKQLRRMVLSELAKADENARVFQTISGKWISLREVKSQPDDIGYTTGQPPFPPMIEPILCLDDSEATTLKNLHALVNVTEKLVRRQRGIERRNAPPRKGATLEDEQRSKCLFVIDVDTEGMKGQVGFLHPNHAGARGIELLHRLRPLCTLIDPEGWPLLTVLNDDTLEPDDDFQALANPKKDQPRILAIVRKLVGPSVNDWLDPQAPARGVIRLPTPFTMRAVQGYPRTPAAIGIFWMPAEWPEHPTIEVEGFGVSQKERIPTIPLTAGMQSGVLPICGKIWVTVDARSLGAALEHAMAWVALRLVGPVRTSMAKHLVERYRWDLALLGVLNEPADSALKELAKDRPDPELMFVVARRAPQLIDKAVGDAPVAAPLPMNIVVEEKVSVGPEAEVPSPLDVHAVPPPGTVEGEGFFAGLVRRVVELVAPTTAPIAETPLTQAVAEALKAMSLTGDPVARVRPVQRGRPVTYHREMREILVNIDDKRVKSAAENANGVLHLVVAALSEINRELAEVTDQEEIAKLFDLLRANDA